LIGCDPGFSEDMRSLGHSRNHAVVERVISDFLRRKVKVEFVESEDSAPPLAVQEESPEREEEDSAEEPDREDVNIEEIAGKKKGQTKSVQEWAAEPVVRESLDLFDGYIAEVRE